MDKIDKKYNAVIFVFVACFIIHLAAAFFIYFANFQPFSGGYGDYILYDQQAREISQRLHQGNFSLDLGGSRITHYYPVLIGYIYAFFWPDMLTGHIFGALLSTLSCVLSYSIVLETGGSKRLAVLISLITSIYPSYLFFGTLLLKDTIVVPLALASLLLAVKLIKKFSLLNFILLYALLGFSIHFRFYIGYALLFTFIFSWLLLYKSQKKLVLGIIMIIFLGFLPQFFGNGYYGSKTIKYYMNIQTVKHYREEAYRSSASSMVQAPPLVLSEGASSGNDFASAISFLKSPLNFLVNISKSFIYVLLGPLPWQIRNSKQLFVLLETIPWYFLFYFVLKGGYSSIRKNRTALPLLIFSLISIGVLALFITNFGIITRIRMPSFIALFCLIPAGLKKKEKNKVCYVTNIDQSARFILFNQLKFLKKEGYDVHIVCSEGKLLEDIEREGIKVKTVRFKRKISPFYDLWTLFRLFFYFSKEKFTIVHTHTPKPGFLGQLAAKLSGVPIIFNTIHGFYFQEKDKKTRKLFYVFVEWIAAKCSDTIFFVNREDMVYAEKMKICPVGKIKYFGGGIDLSFFSPKDYSSNSKTVGIVGRLVKEKGYLDLFSAFSRVLKVFPEAVLMVIGPEEPEKKDRVDISSLIKSYGLEKNILFLGERRDLNELYPKMDVFVLPSYREGLGVSILEASAMERPVVVSDIRGCREAVDDGETGILVPPGNAERIAEAIIYLLKNPEDAKKMGKAGREKIKREFDEKLVFGRIEEEYKKKLKEKCLLE